MLENEQTYNDSVIDIFPDAKVDGRKCTHFRLTHHTRRPDLTYCTAEVSVDDELGIPVYYRAFDWPAKEGEPLRLHEEYFYKSVKLNVGLTDADFAVDNPEYHFQLRDKSDEAIADNQDSLDGDAAEHEPSTPTNDGKQDRSDAVEERPCRARFVRLKGIAVFCDRRLLRRAAARTAAPVGLTAFPRRAPQRHPGADRSPNWRPGPATPDAWASRPGRATRIRSIQPPPGGGGTRLPYRVSEQTPTQDFRRFDPRQDPCQVVTRPCHFRGHRQAGGAECQQNDPRRTDSRVRRGTGHVASSIFQPPRPAIGPAATARRRRSAGGQPIGCG